VPKFRVKVPHLWFGIVEVEAENKWEAIEKVFDHELCPKPEVYCTEFDHATPLGIRAIFGPSSGKKTKEKLPENDYTFLAQKVDE